MDWTSLKCDGCGGLVEQNEWKDVWEMEELASVRAHHTATRAMPILDEYKALTPKQQFKIDKERLTLEHDNRLTIERDLKWLSTYSFPQVTLIQ